MRIRKTFKATVWASAAICVAAVLFLGVSWIAEYRPDVRETVIYDTAEPVFLPDTLTVLTTSFRIPVKQNGQGKVAQNS